MVFRSSIIERVAMKAPLYSIRAGYVSPKGTTNSEEHNELMRRSIDWIDTQHQHT